MRFFFENNMATVAQVKEAGFFYCFTGDPLWNNVLPSSQRERRVSRLNRTGNNTTGWARRLTALLITACLVMAMALPVYAEVDPLPDAPDEVELLEDEPGTASGEDTIEQLPDANAPPEQEADAEQDAATPVPEQSAGPEQPAPTETPEPTAEPTLTPEPTATATATPVPTVTPTATPEPTEQPQKMYAARSVDNVQAVSASANTYTLYFAVPKGWSDYTSVKICAVATNNSNEQPYTLDMQEADKTKDGRKIYSALLNKDKHYPYGGLNGLEFHEYNENMFVDKVVIADVDANPRTWWKTFNPDDKDHYIGGNYYDPEAGGGKWSTYTVTVRHDGFAGNEMAFENKTSETLTNVQAWFYEPDKENTGKLEPVGTPIPLNSTESGSGIASNSTAKFNIPSVLCSYVQFTWEGGSSKYYNFYGEPVSDDDKESFRYSEANNCFIYTSADNVRWGVESSVRIYFDASLSSYSYDGDNGDEGTSKNSMPTKDGGMYCFFKKSDNTYSEVFKMEEEQTTSGRELWYVDVPEGCKKVRFSAWKLEGDKINENIAEKNDLTAMLDIPENLNEPCFFADSGDPDMYASGNINRDGYWGEKKDVRDAEAGKKRTVVDITSKYSRGNSKGIKYITSTLYDYYTDYELNGNNRDNYATDLKLLTYRIHVPFRQFDQAVSDYYKNYKNANSILYPIYTGHFQYVDDHCFRNVAEGLSLFGWSKRDVNESKYKSFMAANNSEIDEGSGSGKYEFAFLGIVGNKLDSNGNLLMRESNGTDGTGLVEPHFNEAFLNGENSKNTKLGQVYKNVEFPFTQKQIFKDEPGVNYWWYDAAKTSLYLRKDKTTGAYYLGNGNGDGSTVDTLSENSKNKDSQNSDTGNGHGFFPFNETVSRVNVCQYNYGYGAKLKIPFTLTEDGTVLDDKNAKQSIKFYFSGDDDVWVFIDGQLVLDIGGAHGKVAGIIDFDQRGANKNKVTAYVSKVKYNNVTKTDYGAGDTKVKKTIVYTGNDLQGERYNPTQYYYYNTVDIPNLSTGKHTLTMYYMERGMWESNMAVAFNLPDNNELQVQKIVDTTNVNDWFKSCFDTSDLFAFTIQNQATHYQEPEPDATITKTGFTTKQEDIPVYGSIEAKGLKNAAGAQFTSTQNNDTQVVDGNGQFKLQNGEIVTFSDQFRRGSYISLKETLNLNLYDTTWTVFENDEAVQSYESGDTVISDTKNLNGQAATESQPGPDDGRIEVYNPAQDIANNGYTASQKPGNANTIVFRSYKHPDESTSSLTKLKVQFVNKVKTGNLVIKKAAASGEAGSIKGQYTFNVTFTNVGGENLEQETIEKPVTIDMSTEKHEYVIEGIPIGTCFRIEEVTPTGDGSHLKEVSVTGGGDGTQVVANTYVQGSISETDVIATFTNTKHELINIDFTKTWENANGSPLEDGLPGEIYIQLQRRKAENDPWQPVWYPDANTKYVTVTPNSNGWDCAFTFANLDKFDVEDHTNYEYRIVEGTVDNNDHFTEVEPKETIPIKGNTYVVTAEATPKSETSSEDSSTGNTATVTPGGTITGGSGTIVLTNTLQNPKFALDIIKKDAEKDEHNNDVFLKDVEFKLEKLVETTNEGEPQKVDTTYKFDNENTGSITATTGENGKITDKFTNLEPGTYRLTEIKAHPGYNLLAQPIKIQFTQGGECYIDGEKITDTKTFVQSGNTYTMTLTVLNRKTPELPHTGADAPSLWLLIGLPLAVAGLLIFTFRYNRKGGRRH